MRPARPCIAQASRRCCRAQDAWRRATSVDPEVPPPGPAGDGECQDRSLPVRVKGLEGVKVVSVACGWRHSAAVDDQGRLLVWGWGRWGQLGLGDCK